MAYTVIVAEQRCLPPNVEAIHAIKTGGILAGDVVVLARARTIGNRNGGKRTSLRLPLKHLPFGKYVSLITDARFSGCFHRSVTGCVGPEALAGGLIGKLRERRPD